VSVEVEPNDWVRLDVWWSSYTQAQSLAQSGAAARTLEKEGFANYWEETDLWWDVFTESGHEMAVDIHGILEQSNDEWDQSDGPFDSDPLAADLTLDRVARGPLQPTNEMGWSRWLARVLGPSPRLVSELLDIEVAERPEEVIREDQLSKHDGSIRRPDLLLCYEDYGVSIEVKLGDENYRKTAETAALVEDHYGDREWTHVLLLPKRKTGRLESIVDPPVTSQSDGQLEIEWDDPGAISIVHWRDVTAAVRFLLRRGDAADDSWAANSYLFCSAVEQQIAGFQPGPMIERLAAPKDVVDSIQPIRFASSFEEQLTYLQTVIDS